MKKHGYIWMIVLMVMASVACTREVIYDRSNLPDGVLVIDAYPAGFTRKVSRVAKNSFEYKITNKGMLIFDANGQKVTFRFEQGQDAAFVINRKNDPEFKGKDPKLLEKCKIFVVANIPESAFNAVQDTVALNNVTVNAITSTVHLDKLVNYPGLPMIGSIENVDLSPNAKNIEIAAPIKLNTLYAKVVVDVQLQTEQNVNGHIPFFIMEGWSVKNMPTYTKLGAPQKGSITECNVYFSSPMETTVSDGELEVSNNRGHTRFEFYTLERHLNPANIKDTATIYPKGLKPNEYQRYKPKLCNAEQNPMYIEIKGYFWDHQKHEHNVIYKVYLGENNYNDFNVRRNYQLTNDIYIRGLSKTSTSKGEVTVDHRVDVDETEKHAYIKIERETMLDSHIEIRPIDVTMKTEGPGNRVEVGLMDPKDTTKFITADNANFQWVRFEKLSAPKPGAEAKYCSQGNSAGKRKYFTTNLMTELKDNVSATITKNNDSRVWVYFDENLMASKDGMRDVIVRFSVYEDNVLTQKIDYKFMQHDLYPVTTADGKTYFIEFYEEYLYNFDPKDSLTNRKEGMAWGDTIFYSETPAIEGLDNSIDKVDLVRNGIIEAGGKYDFRNNYTGKKYTEQLLRISKYTDLPLDSSPRSAAEYCYNKNKRTDAGIVETATANWYLPAIGEIQDITSKAFTEFREFQNNYYWSSQTTYGNAEWTYTGIKNHKGTFTYEDTEFARATMTQKDGTTGFTFIPSEVIGRGMWLETWWSWKPFGVTYNKHYYPREVTRDEGNKLRNKPLRVRAVRDDPNGIITLRQ